MGRWVADSLHREVGERAGSALVLGLTFKEDVPDLRNSKVIDVIRRLEALGHRVTVHDPRADPAEARHEYDVALDGDALDRRYDLVVAAVPHAEYRALPADRIRDLVGDGGCVADLKGIWRRLDLGAGVRRWTL
jgi:UDP-N-acetyl-D-galactosamine dehydrogenase